MANTYVERTIATGSSPTKLTISMWIKGMADPGAAVQRSFFGFRDNGDTDRFFNIYMSSNGSLYAYWKDSSLVFTLGTMQKFRDPNAWGHFVLAMDTTDATAADRVKMYWNGERITAHEDSLDTITQSKVMDILGDTDGRITVGAAKTGSTWHYWDGCISQVQYVDGLALAPTEFGAVDATTGEWKVGTASYATPGTNGFHLKFENSANLDLDSSSNAHTFTTSGTLTSTEDSPSNNFAIINPVQVEGGGSPAFTFANGNTKVTRSGNWRGHMSSIGVNKGKWYWEIKCTGNVALGIGKFGGDVDNWTYLAGGQSWLGDKNDVWILYNNASSQVKYTGGSSGGNWGTVTGDAEIVMIAFDADNGIIWTGNGGTWHESATEAEIEAGTTTNAMYSGISIGSDFFGSVGAVENGNLEYNFGNGYFGTTAVSSAGTNASGFGIFEYDVPAGFTALCTKGLNE